MKATFRFNQTMNKTEMAYAEYLRLLIAAKQIKRFDFEPEKLRLADSTYFIPDFRVIKMDDTVEFHEVKGFWRDDARVKIKVAAEMHPYVFKAVKKNKGGWEYEEF